MDSKIVDNKLENKEIIDIRHYLKGVIWDILIDVYMQDIKHTNLKEIDTLLEKLQALMEKIDQKGVLRFAKVLLQELEILVDKKNDECGRDFEEVFL
jgi:hypothetical protein